jgi:hypothetical protein
MEKLICRVTLVNPPPGVNTEATVFEVLDGQPYYKGGPGYIDGILAEFHTALDHARWQHKEFGFWDHVVFNGYRYQFRPA